MIRHLRNLTSAAVLAAAFCALVLPSMASAAIPAQPLLVSLQTGSGSFLPQNAAQTQGILVLNGIRGATFTARGRRTGVLGQDAAILLGRRLPDQALLQISGARPRFVALRVRSIQYAPPFGLFAHVTVQPRSQSTLLRQRFRGASSPLPLRFARATLFAAPTGLRVSSSGLPTGAGLRSTSYDVTYTVSSTLRAGTDLDFKVQNSNCAESVDSGPAHITYNPQTFQDTAFKAIDSGDCFWKFSEATWAVSVVYPGKHPVYEAAWLYFKINQLGPKLYGTSCTVPQTQKIKVNCSSYNPGYYPGKGATHIVLKLSP